MLPVAVPANVRDEDGKREAQFRVENLVGADGAKRSCHLFEAGAILAQLRPSKRTGLFIIGYGVLLQPILLQPVILQLGILQG